MCLLQCLSMVDHYTQLFFTQVSTIKSDQICKRLNLCQAVTPAFASQVHQGNCEACRETVSEVVTKLKDPETKVCSTFIPSIITYLFCVANLRLSTKNYIS